MDDQEKRLQKIESEIEARGTSRDLTIFFAVCQTTLDENDERHQRVLEPAGYTYSEWLPTLDGGRYRLAHPYFKNDDGAVVTG
jgi:hypothetical protein